MPPAQTTGTPKSASSAISASALFGPACPPARVAERGDEETDPRLDRLIHEPLHPLQVDLGGTLDDDIHPHRLGREAADELQALAELVPVDVDHGERLDYPDAAGL